MFACSNREDSEAADKAYEPLEAIAFDNIEASADGYAIPPDGQFKGDDGQSFAYYYA